MDKSKGRFQYVNETTLPDVMNLKTEQLKKDVATGQYRLYRVTWPCVLASQLAAAV